MLISLWSVEDESPNRLTERVFMYLQQGQATLEALHQARVDLRQASHEHAFFWTPFIPVEE
jgi:CHAT domain-containing protein